jgi:hypothetical protein
MPNHVQDLRKLYEQDPYSRAILEDFALRSNNQQVTKVDQIISRLKDSELPRWAAIKTFRKLQDLEYGVFKEGRRGHPSRFEWNTSSIDVGKVARGENLRIARIEDDGDEENEEHVKDASTLIPHSFYLRPDITVVLRLPPDLTQKEAERLSTFISSLPQ